MKKIVLGAALLVVSLMIYSFKPADKPAKQETEKINWMSWEEAIDAAQKSPKKIFIDVYTDWCGWCKKMDQSTFADEAVAKYVNKHFYAVKFDAEQKEDVTYKGYTLKFKAAGRRGFHELAYSLLDGRMGYPSYVYLDENQDRISISPGYKEIDPFMKELVFIAENHYKSKSFKEFAASKSE